MPITSTDSMRLKNEALHELVGRHVIIGFHKDQRWVGGKLSCVRGVDDQDRLSSRTETLLLDRPIIWALEQFLPPRVAGYERPVEVFLTTPDIAWWAPATPKQSDKDFAERREQDFKDAEDRRKKAASKR
jgi:hypothetical protein